MITASAVTARAHRARPFKTLGVVLLVLVTGVFYGPAWVAGRVWFCIVWAGCAIAEAFAAGAHPKGAADK